MTDLRCGPNCAGRVVDLGDGAMFMCGPCGKSRAVPATPDDAAQKRATEDAVRAWGAGPPLTLSVGRHLGFVLLGQLQLALRHPMNTGNSAEAAEGFARYLQDQLELPPDLAVIAAAGWNPECDA